MAWIQAHNGDFVNLAHVMQIQAVLTEDDTACEAWAQLYGGGQMIQLPGSWEAEEDAQDWIVSVLYQAGEKVLDGVVIHGPGSGWIAGKVKP